MTEPRDAVSSVAGAGLGVLLVAHGTVESLDDLPEFLTNIRRGHPAPPELVAEVRRRYEAIGGRSPLLAVSRELASKLEAELGVPVRTAMRLFHPYPQAVLPELVALGVQRLVVVPLAQHSAHVYGDAVKEAARAVAPSMEVRVAPNWGQSAGLTAAFADRIARALRRWAAEPSPSSTALVLTAHSLPQSVIDAGDPYEREVRASAALVASATREVAPNAFAENLVVFQSQGMSQGPGGRPVKWLGPDLRAALESLRSRGRTRALVAPIGFLADHVEILYDLDIEANAWAAELGIDLERTESLNASDDFVRVLASVVENAVLASTSTRG